MTSKDLESYFILKTQQMIDICTRKNHDYAGSENPFTNFELVEKLGITSAEIGFLTRISDKLSRVSSFIKQGTLKVEDEKIEDTLLDMANYSLLLAAYIKSKKEVS